MQNINEKIENALSNDCKKIMKILDSHNFDSYAVGGCVRDALIGVPCHDEDITTNALPEEVIKVFKREGYNIVETGLKHGTVTVFDKGSKTGFEITTFRSDGDYSDGRHPDSVIFETNIEKDLERRDLTINAMAYSLSKGFTSARTIDENGVAHDGLSDLENHVIRAVGNAHERFSEDALRIMRAVRFKAKMNSLDDSNSWVIADDVKNAITLLSNTLEKISKERIRDEFLKTINTGDISAIRDLQELGVLKVILPDLDKCVGFKQFNIWHDKDVFEHILSSVSYGTNMEERIALLLHDIGKVDACKYNTNLNFDEVNRLSEISIDVFETLKNFKENQTVNNFRNLLKTVSNNGMNVSNVYYKIYNDGENKYVSNSFSGHADISAEKAINILKDLKFSNDEISNIISLIKHHDFAMTLYDADRENVEKYVANFMVSNQKLANKEFFKSLEVIKNADSLSQNLNFEGNQKDKIFRKMLFEIVQEKLKGPHLMSDLAINGNDLMELGFNGKGIQRAKEILLRKVILDNDLNNKESLLKFSKGISFPELQQPNLPKKIKNDDFTQEKDNITGIILKNHLDGLLEKKDDLFKDKETMLNIIENIELKDFILNRKSFSKFIELGSKEVSEILINKFREHEVSDFYDLDDISKRGNIMGILTSFDNSHFDQGNFIEECTLGKKKEEFKKENKKDLVV